MRDLDGVRFVNLTPHAVTLPGMSVPASGVVARCQEATLPVGRVGGVELVQRSYGAVDGLPDEQPGTIYIVSALVRLALTGRRDLASPGDLIRGEDGRVVGAHNLVVN